MPRWAGAGLLIFAGLAIAGIILSTVALYALESRVHALEVRQCMQYAVLHAHHLAAHPPPPFC